MHDRFRVNSRASRPVLFSVALVLSAGSGTILPVVAQDVDALPKDDLERGRNHYMASCGRCHGVNGGGGEGPPLARARLPRAPDDASLIRIMNEGIPGTAMPPIRSISRWLSEEELRLVAGYVRSLAPSGAAVGERVAGDPARGRELYESGRCAGCHTVGGFGTGRGPDLTTVGSRRGATYLREAILDPGASLPRSQTAMPSDFLGYLMVRVMDRDGNDVLGMRMNEDTYTIQLKDDRGNLYSFYKPALREVERQFDRSLMRSYRDRFTDEEVDDLVSYLMTLTGPEARLTF